MQEVGLDLQGKGGNGERQPKGAGAGEDVRLDMLENNRTGQLGGLEFLVSSCLVLWSWGQV